MDKIQLLYVENIVTRDNEVQQQTLNFFMVVENLSYDKQVDVLWSGADGIWHVLPALFHSRIDSSKEYWQVKTSIQQTPATALPGNISFSLRYRALGKEFQDNHNGLNYLSPANSGIRLAHDLQLLNIGFSDKLVSERKFMSISVAVDPTLELEKVIIHWTTDNWSHVHQTPCHFRKSAHNKKLLSPSKGLNRGQVELWKGRINVTHAFRLQYCIAGYSKNRVWWDNNYGQNYAARHKPLKVMILNLHCYQEEHQDHKFSQIAKAIDDLQVDIVCLQEVAELWNNGQGDWNSNSARIINDRLPKPFNLHTDWSHMGFDKYREGVAILSRYPMSNHDARYVSESADIYSIHSRKVVNAQINVPGIGALNVFSAHLSWWEDGFAGQFKRLSEWAATTHSRAVKATLLCGDFNIAAGSVGYQLVVQSNEYEDQFLAAERQGIFEKIFRVNDPYWSHYLADDYRIDYIFMNKHSSLKVTAGEVLFTDDYYGRVSDHCGYLMTFEPK